MANNKAPERQSLLDQFRSLSKKTTKVAKKKFFVIFLEYFLCTIITIALYSFVYFATLNYPSEGKYFFVQAFQRLGLPLWLLPRLPHISAIWLMAGLVVSHIKRCICD